MHETPATTAWYGDWYRPSEPTPPPRARKPDPPKDPDRRDPDHEAPPQQPGAPPMPAAAREPTGLVLGRFLPPHRGHQYLLDFARASVRELTVILCSSPDDPIPSKVRLAWLRELCPTAELLHEPTDGERRSLDAWEAAVRKQAPAVATTGAVPARASSFRQAII